MTITRAQRRPTQHACPLAAVGEPLTIACSTATSPGPRQGVDGRRYGSPVPPPVLPAALQHRPMHPDDAPAWADLLAVIEEVDGTGEHHSAADLARELADPDLDLDHDSVLVLDGGRPVAYQVLRLRAGPDGNVVHTDGGVHPAFRARGLGSYLLDLAQRRAGDLDAGLQVRVPAHVADAVALAEGAGFVAARWWSTLHRDLTRPVEPAPLAEGLELHLLGPGYDAVRWDEPLRAARNASFTGHFGSAPESADTFAHHRTGSRAFRSECSAAACTPDGQVVGFLLAFEFDARTAATGNRDLYVMTVGTLEPWRGRGIGGALLAHALLRAQEQGFGSSSLTVDEENATGALGVYTRAGYGVASRAVTYVPTLWPASRRFPVRESPDSGARVDG